MGRSDTRRRAAAAQSVAEFPIVGKKAYATWSKAHNDLPGFIKSMQPKVGELAGKALGIVANLGGGVLMFLFSFIIAVIMMAYGESGAHAMQATFQRIAGIARRAEFTNLATSTVRAVAAGVIGIACIQALLIGVAVLIAGVPFAGVLAVIVLVLGIVQVPAAIVTLPVIVWIWLGGDYETTPAIAYTVLLMVAGSGVSRLFSGMLQSSPGLLQQHF